MGKINKLAKVTTTLSITAGQYLLALAPNQPWSVGLAAFVTLLAGSSELANILFDDIDIQKLRDQIENNPDDARLFWSIIDAGLREAAQEKIRIYNSYLKGAFEDIDIAKENNSKVLLVIQQITVKELDIFQKIYTNFEDLQIINLFHRVDSNNKTSKKEYDSADLNKWLDEFVEKNSKKLSKENYLKDIRFEQSGFFILDLKKHKLFVDLDLKNEIEMLATYGLLQSTQAMNGSIYHLTDFGNFVFDFIENNKQ
jgi:hypothetical protein